MKFLRASLVLTCLTFVDRVHAQTALGDSDDHSAVIAGKYPASFGVNLANDSVKVNITPLTVKDNYLSLELKGKAADGVSTLFDGKNFSNEFGMKVGFAKKDIIAHLFKQEEATPNPKNADTTDIKKWVDWLQLSAGYTRGSYSIFTEGKEVGESIEDTAEDLGEAGAAYNLLSPKGNALIALAGGVRKTSNYSSLSKITGIQREVVAGSGANTITVEEEVEARSGELKTYTQVFGNLDVFVLASAFDKKQPAESNVDFPFSRLKGGAAFAVDFFLRCVDENADGKSEVNPGIGLLLVEKGNPSSIKSGLTAKYVESKDDIVLGLVFGFKY